VILAFVEGLRSTVLPCSLTLIVPVVAVALAARRPTTATISAVLATLAAMWVRAAGLVPVPATRWVAVILALFALAMFGAWIRSDTRAYTWLAVIPGALAGWIWQPCVGRVLGDILQAAGERTPSSVLLLGAYALGVLIPAFAVALARVSLGDPPRLRRALRVAGAAIGILVAGVVFAGQDGRVIGWLARISS
jgi:cytochrome c biogenesis protein CcdA